MNVCSCVHTLKCCHGYILNILTYICVNIKSVAMATLINNHYYMNVCSCVPLLVYHNLSKMLPWLQKLKM